MDHFPYDVTRAKVSGNGGKDCGKNNELTEEDIFDPSLLKKKQIIYKLNS